MTTGGELYLHEQVMLMALNDERGTTESKATNANFALAGAVLSELLLRERVTVTDDKKKFVEVKNATAIGDPVLDECLNKIAGAKRRRRAADWVGAFASQGKIRRQIAQRLCDRGILREAEGKILLIFKRKIFPEIDSRPEQHLLAELRRALDSEKSPVKPRLAALIALANATGLLRVYFDRKELKARKSRINEIVSGAAIEGATREAMAAAHAAMIAMMAATVAATSAASSG